MAPPSRKITVQVEEADPASDPVVVSFPGGVAPADPPQFVYRRVKEGAKRGRTLVGKDSTCLYEASNPGRGYDGRRTKLCVGVYNKTTGKLTVHLAAEKGNVFTLQQSVRNYTPSDSINSKLTAIQRRKALFADFGSSKKQKVMKSQEANRVTVDSVIGAGSIMSGAFEKQSSMSASNRKALEESKLGQKSDAVEQAYAEARKKFLPGFDIDAKEPHMVYSARDIAGDDAWGRISRVADACLHQGPSQFLTALTERGVWHNCITSVIQTIPLDAPNAKNQVKTCILLNHCITFHLSGRNMLRGDAKSIGRDLSLPTDVAARLLELFTTSLGAGGRDSKYARSKQSKDKCMVYMLLLYMMAHGRSMKIGSIKPIVDDCKMELVEASNLLREAGCTVVRQGAGNASAVLTVPLTFPAPKRGGRKG